MSRISQQADEFRKANRVKIIADCILKGYSGKRLREIYSKEWDICERSVGMYITEAYKSIRESLKDDIENIRETNINRLIDLYNDAFNTNDRASMFKSLDMLNKMFGMYEDKKTIDVQVTNFKFGFSDDAETDDEQEE